MLPDFLVIGAAKSGSTSLTAMLRQHPDLFMPEHEVAFFAKDDVYARGIDWYTSLFADGCDARLRGENSNHYTMRQLYPEAFSRLRTHLGDRDLRLLYLVRHPLRRIESHWIEKRSHGGDEVHHDFNRAVFLNRDRLLDPSDYWRQLEPYLQHFGRDRIQIVFSEELEADPVATMQRCFDFLDVEPYEATRGVSLNAASTKQVQRTSVSRLRQLPLYRSVAGRVPTGVRRAVRQRLFFTPVEGRPRWHPEVRSAAIEALRDGTEALLRFADRPADHWALDEPQPDEVSA